MLGTFGPKKVYLFMLVSRLLFLMIFKSGSDVWDWKAKRLALDVLQKATFVEIGILIIPGPIFYDFGWTWDQFP